MAGYIKLHRQITEWEWFSDVNVLSVFIHLLLLANFKDTRWKGIEIKRGQLITSYRSLAQKTKLSIQQTRTVISKLQSTGEITVLATRRYTLITIANYGKYQGGDDDSNTQNNTQITHNQHTDNTLATHEQQQYKNVKKDKKDKNERNTIGPLDRAIENFKEHRKKLRKPMTDYAVGLLIKKLDKLADTNDEKIALIDYAIDKGWQSVYPMDKGRASPQKPVRQRESFERPAQNLDHLAVDPFADEK